MISEILYIEAQSPYLNIVTTDPQKEICIRRSLSDIVNEMDKSLFIQCHRSYIVNIMHIRAIVRTQVVLSDNTMLPLSKRHMTDIYKAFDDYYQGRYI